MQRILKLSRRLGWALLAGLVLAALAIQLSGHGYFWRALGATYFQGHATAHIDDAANFPQRVIPAGPAQDWPKDPRYNQQPLAPETQAYLKQYGTAGFLVAQNGALVHEQYFAPYDQNSRTNSFSVAKTITTMQVGLAIQQGFIPGFDAPITGQLPEYAKDARGAKATLAQLSSMKAGHDWTEDYYLPLNITTELYFGQNARQLVLGQGFEREPGSAHRSGC
jgi:CubicO group peptidase (beta-lactamase class C family)